MKISFQSKNHLLGKWKLKEERKDQLRLLKRSQCAADQRHPIVRLLELALDKKVHILHLLIGHFRDVQHCRGDDLQSAENLQSRDALVPWQRLL